MLREINYMIYFISGHKDTTKEQFKEHYIPAIEKIIQSDSSFGFIVGDCEGLDLMAQSYLVTRGFTNKVFVYHLSDKPRNIADGITKLIGGFSSDKEREAAMTKDSDFDIAFILHPRSGAKQNILRRHVVDEQSQ